MQNPVGAGESVEAGGPVRIRDLAAPEFTPEVVEMRAAMAEMAGDCPLESGALHRRAAEETGLEDFGDDAYRDGLEVLLAALGDSGLSPAGRVVQHTQLVQLLKNRLLLVDLLGRHPEIHEVELAPPIIVAGLPRTGTTHLHNLLAADPALRSLPYWESLEPFPAPGEEGMEPDPRIERTDQGVWFMNEAMPLFPLMHEMTTWHVHEEIQLLAIDFSSMLFETASQVPAYGAWYRAHDQVPHYRFLRTVLQALQFLRGGRRWVLKSPQHIEQFPVLAEVFPEATVVVTHRDPVEVVVSLATMIAYTARMSAERVDPVAIGRYWADRVEAMLRACVEDRERLVPSRSIDVRFDEFMADDLAMVRRIYALADQPWDERAQRATAEYLDGHRRGRHGRVDYRAEAVGLEHDELRDRFAFYVERFL